MSVTMNFAWTALSVLVLLSLARGQVKQQSDSLRNAIEAVSRRQRDLAASGPNYYANGGLSPYRYQDSIGPGNEIAFLTAPKDFSGDGQPENIGYGYQKTISSPSGVFSPQASIDVVGPVIPEHTGKRESLEKMLAEYLGNEWTARQEKEENEQKTSLFRERTDANAKRSLHSSHSSLVDDVEERKRKILTSALLRKMEEEEEQEERDRHRERHDEEGDITEEKYLDFLRSVWDKYRRDNTQVIDIEDISEGDVSQILNYLGNSDVLNNHDVEEEISKRQHGGYDFNTHNAALSGWGGHGFRKRWNQRLDGDENQKGSFLYSLKFVSPGINREAIESLKDEDDLEFPDERDEDVLRLRQDPELLFSAFDGGETPEDLFDNSNEEEYQRLVLAQQNDHQSPSRKRLSPLMSHYRGPDKKYFYDTAIIKKRYPVSKRSSNFYTSPPLLHHKNFLFTDSMRKKKDAATTDPKVVRELNQIFSLPDSGDHAHFKDTTDDVHVATTHAPVLTTMEYQYHNITGTDSPNNQTSASKNVEKSVTPNQSETPLDIKKKSIDWSDYFGIDRRRKKDNGDPANPVNNQWFLNQYYKTLATNTNPHAKTKKTELQQPFDTRVFGSAQRERSDTKQPNTDETEEQKIEKMDTKLRNIEDLIVNEAVKYTGAHEGTSDTKEIQDVKDKVMARLAAAYSLEKMRHALNEFKSSLMAQKMSQEPGGGDEKKKRVAVKKEKADDKKKRGNEDDVPDVQLFSEGGIAPQDLIADDDMDCPVLDQVTSKCHEAGRLIGDLTEFFLPFCRLHQMCYLCGSDTGGPSPAACDLMFITKAETLCSGDSDCEHAAQRIIAILRKSQGQIEEGHCWRRACPAW